MDEAVSQITARPFEAAEALFYAIAFALGGASGIVRAGCDNSFRSGWHLFCIGMVSGLFSFSVVALLCDRGSGVSGYQYSLWAMAILLGMTGTNWQGAVIKSVLYFTLKKFGVQIREPSPSCADDAEPMDPAV